MLSTNRSIPIACYFLSLFLLASHQKRSALDEPTTDATADKEEEKASTPASKKSKPSSSSSASKPASSKSAAPKSKVDGAANGKGLDKVEEEDEGAEAEKRAEAPKNAKPTTGGNKILEEGDELPSIVLK